VSLDRGIRPLAVTMAAGTLARLPQIMVGLSLVLLLRETGYSYALIGGATAAYVLTGGVGAPVLGRVADRVGSTPVLLAAAGASAAVLTVLALYPRELGPAGVVAVAAAAGVGVPPVTAVLRGAMPRLADAAALRTAYSLEAAVQEILFIVGPVLVVLIVALWSPRAAVLACAAGDVVLVSAFVLVVRRAPAAPRRRAGAGWALRSRRLVLLLAVYGLLGITFGAVELAVIAAMDDAGHRGAAGVVLGAWAAGSLVGGIVVARRARAAPAERLPPLLVALGVLTLPLALLCGNPVLLGAGLMVQGAVIAPTLGTIYETVPGLADEALLTEAFAWSSSFVFAGVAAGNAAAGILSSWTGPPVALLPAAVAPLAAWPVAAALRTAARSRATAPSRRTT
jgi:predicted MFS family arabinose efflux permease